MFNSLIRLALILTSVFGLCILLIRSRPHESEIAPFMTPRDGCAEPCFLGIQPGITTAQQAYALLDNSGWTENLTFAGEFYFLPMTWDWSSDAPPLFQPTGEYYDGSLRIQDNIVQFVELKTHLALGDALVKWGEPDAYTYLMTTGGPIGRPPPPRPFTFLYPNLTVIAPTRCSYRERFWRSNTTLIIGPSDGWLNIVLSLPAERISHPLLKFVADTHRHYCGI